MKIIHRATDDLTEWSQQLTQLLNANEWGICGV